MKLDAPAVFSQPDLARLVEPVTGRIVNDEEDLAWSVARDELLEELVEGVSVEDGSEAEGEVGFVEGDGPE
jgi:hypothetical protein